jgi:hypothetical protein
MTRKAMSPSASLIAMMKNTAIESLANLGKDGLNRLAFFAAGVNRSEK